jgi:hypothetical protein
MIEANFVSENSFLAPSATPGFGDLFAEARFNQTNAPTASIASSNIDLAYNPWSSLEHTQRQRIDRLNQSDYSANSANSTKKAAKNTKAWDCGEWVTNEYVYGNADLVGPFWDIRHVLYPTESTRTLATWVSDCHHKVKEGDTIIFAVEMQAELFNSDGRNETPRHVAAAQKIDDLIRLAEKEGDLEQMGIAQEKYRKFRYPGIYNPAAVPSAPAGVAYVSTNTLTKNAAGSSGLASFKDFEAIGTLIGVSDQWEETTFAVQIYEDLEIEQDETFVVEMRQNQSAVPAVNNLIHRYTITIEDNSTPPEVPILVKYSRAQNELLKIISEDDRLSAYIANLESFVSGMPEDEAGTIYEDLQNNVFKKYLSTLDKGFKPNMNTLRSAFRDFCLKPEGLAVSLIQNAVSKYIITPQANAALGRLDSLRNFYKNAKITALRVGETKDLMQGGSPAANAIIQRILSKL